MIELFDTHAHLQGPEFKADADAVIARAQAAGVTRILVPAVDAESALAARALARRNAGVYVAAGCHPHEASRLTGQDLDLIEGVLSDPASVAVGEIGLDFFRMHSPRADQVRVFETMLRLAAEKALPVVVHCRDAEEAVYPILSTWARGAAPSSAGRCLGVMHYFAGDAAAALRYVELGFLISVHTSITHPKASRLREVATEVPLDFLVIETDSPFGSPQAHRGKRNEPAYVAEAARAIASLLGLDLEDVARQTTANARRLFALEESQTVRARMGAVV